jgi:AcrR family transcriptional regulator
MKVTDASLRVGSLKGKALDAAMRLVELHGVERLNLRDLAAVLGTGPASLYYHFKNKDALLAELAAEGFRQLNRAFLKVQADPGDRPALYGCCATYLHFMRERSALYQLMFDERVLTRQAVARAAEQEAFQTFARAPAGRGDGSSDVACTLWALGRGTAALCMAAGEPNEAPARDVAQRVVRGLEVMLGYSVRWHAAKTEPALLGPNPARDPNTGPD